MDIVSQEKISNLFENKKICKKCVLPESKPDIWLNDEGVCNICIEHKKLKKDDNDRGVLETDFVEMLNQYKRRTKGKYDCLVMCSGGKDSTSSLYYMKKRYRLNPLAFTFDHGFETEEAMENVKRAVRKLEVDYLVFKTDFMKDMFVKILKSNSKAIICHPCSIWYMDLTFKMANRFKIPIIIAGWTKGQSTKQPVMSRCGCNVHQSEFKSMAEATNKFLEDYQKSESKYKNFPKSMKEVLVRAKKKYKKNKAVVLSPHWFLPYSSNIYVETIKKELNWKYPKLSYPAKSTNCTLNFVSVYNSMKYYGYTHYHVEMSKLIRENLLTREEALNNLKVNFDKSILDSVSQEMGLGKFKL